MTHRKARWPVPKPPPWTHPTWVLATAAPLDETDNEQDQYQEGYGAHEPDEPALGGDVGPVVGVSCRRGGQSKQSEGLCMGEGEEGEERKAFQLFPIDGIPRASCHHLAALWPKLCDTETKKKIIKEPRSKGWKRGRGKG